MENNSSKSLLPLIEIIISIGIFAIAVVLTLQLFLLAKFLGNKTSDSADAMFEIQNVAEQIKMCDTPDKMNDFIKNTALAVNDDSQADFVIYYDEDFNKIDPPSFDSGSLEEAKFYMNIKRNINTNESGELYEYDLKLYKSTPYPFIEDKRVEADVAYIPLLAEITSSKFIIK